jgi:hypothetical protein
MRPAPPRPMGPGVTPRPKGPVPMPPAPTGPGRGRGGMAPPPGMMFGPNDALTPIPKKGGAATGGGTPVRVMGGPADKMGPGAVTPGMPKMKAGGTVKSSAPSKSPRPAPRPADLKANYDLDRAMRGTESKAIKEDLRAGREDRMSKPSAPSKSPRPMRSPVKKAMGGMVKGYKDGGCVMAGRGGKYKGMM